jgi:hypothetical protein
MTVPDVPDSVPLVLVILIAEETERARAVLRDLTHGNWC